MTAVSSLPERASRSIAPSLNGAFRAVGYTCLGAALISTFAFQSNDPGDVLWPAIVALMPMLLLLWLDDRVKSFFISASFLVVGAIAIFIYIVDFYDQVRPSLVSDAFTPALVKVPLLMVSGVGVTLVSRLLWCLAGLIVAELASAAAVMGAQQPLFFDIATYLAFVMIVLFVIGADFARRRAVRSEKSLSAAAQDEELAAMRHRIELQAAALLHDTVLSHLAAIANAPIGSKTSAIRTGIEHDVEILVSQQWLGEGDSGGFDEQEKVRVTWQGSAVFAAIRESEALGLIVQPTGDLAALAHLTQEQAAALGLAVKQCLVNVLHHSGTDTAEVAIDAMPTEVSVMVVDAGRGFNEKDTGADRLGLRHSVRRRMELVGGTVQVWSTPGRGTSIIIRVPVADMSSREPVKS
jgi:signal transduction histidine kinase